MGGNASNLRSSVVNNISITKAVAESYLNITQDIAQGTYNTQVVGIDCTQAQDVCLQCIQGIKDAFDKAKSNIPNSDITEMCHGVCTCDIHDIKLDQQISVNFSAFQKLATFESFKTGIMNSIYTQAKQSGGGINFYGINSDDTTTILNKSIQNIYSSVQQDSFQSIIQSLKTLQNVELSGAGEIANVDMVIAVDFISKIVQNDSSMSQDIQQLESAILSASTQVTQSGLAQVILWIIRLIILVVCLIFLVYVVNLVFNIYSVYVQK